MELFISLCLGIGLAAACGFRVFVPLFLISAAQYAGLEILEFTDGFQWIGSLPSLITFGVASIIEIFAYYIPFVDNVLDTIAIPLAAVAGTLVTMGSVMELEPLWRWSIALIAGGGVAGMIKGSGAAVRAASSVKTAGIGNPVVSTVETGTSIGLTALAVLLPVAAFVVVALILWLVYRTTRRIGSFLKKKRGAEASP